METTLYDIARIIGLDDLRPPFCKRRISTLLTDSRSLLDPEETLFFAIPTKTNAGERYMRDLYDRGVRNFIAPSIPDDMAGLDDAAILLYPDPVEALQLISARQNLPLSGNHPVEIVAITGSKGKTTLKEWLFQLLEPFHNIVRSPRSYNSQIGVPLSMWEIGADTGLALIEAGISRKGEMANLARCIAPDAVIFTDMGEEHADGFKDFREKVAEKVTLATSPSVKKVFFCADDPILKAQIEHLPPEITRFSWSMTDDLADLRIICIEKTGIDSPDGNVTGTRIRYKLREKQHAESLDIPVSSDADARNACHALNFMTAEGFEPHMIAGRFLTLHHMETRLSVSDGGNGSDIIYDSYTSDFSSLAPALDFMTRRRTPGQEAIVILSDLRHEAEDAASRYARIARLISLRDVSLFIGVGSNLSVYASLFPKGSLFFTDTSALNTYLREHPVRDSIVLLKGAPEFGFESTREILEERTHETLLEVNLDAMIRNYKYFKSHLPVGTGLVAMVKASGYGAGSFEIAKSLQDAGAAYLAVAVLDEGLDLRRRGITMPIMVMNPRVADYREMFIHRLEPEIYTRRMLDEVIDQARRYNVKDFPIHIKLDTGMHRMGFIEEELPELMQAIGAQDNVRISSVFSHLATADEPTMNDYTEFQLENFDRCSGYMLSHCAYTFRRHVLNSAGILRYADKYHYDMARLGIGLYGVNTLPEEMEKPLAVVSTLKSVIINLREWPTGTTIGYGRRGVLTRPSLVATIPIGYADGMNRKFGNGAVKVLVNGREAPTIGNICMDACMIDVTGIECAEGDSVEIFGEHLGVQRLADVIGTIPYEILTAVSPRVKRVYFRE